MAAPAAALRALNSAFVRKGIVATSDCERRALPDAVRVLLDTLKLECARACENARDVASAMQVWKERSLYQTLESLDTGAHHTTAATNSHNDSQRDRQIEAIEAHELAGRELSELLQRHRIETTREVHSEIEAFAESLTDVLSGLIRPEVVDELEREQAIMRQLVAEKQRLDHAHAALEQSNHELAARLEVIESAPDGGGDAVLCNKLRVRVRELASSERKLLASVATMESEREQHRWVMLQLRNELELQQRTLVLTKAMHEKEMKQLVELVQSRQRQFAHVMQTTSGGNDGVVVGASTLASPGSPEKRMQSRAMPPLEVYDPVSGRTVQFANTSPQKPLLASGRVVLPFAASPPQSPVRSTVRGASADRGHRQHQRYHHQQRSNSFELSMHKQRLPSDDSARCEVPADAAAQPQPASPRGTNVQSPTGRVRRLVPTSNHS